MVSLFMLITLVVQYDIYCALNRIRYALENFSFVTARHRLFPVSASGTMIFGHWHWWRHHLKPLCVFSSHATRVLFHKSVSRLRPINF